MRVLAGCAIFSASSAGQARQDGATAIMATQSVAADGTLTGPVTMVFSDGVIQRVERGQTAPEGVGQVVRYEGVLCPGLIDLCSGLGMTGGRAERQGTKDASHTAVDGYDVTSAQVSRAARSGVTSALVCSAGNQIIGGVSSLVSTWAPAGQSCVLRREGPLMITLGPSTWDVNEGQSSRAGALYDLRETLSEAATLNNGTRLERFVHGKLPGIIRADAYEDVDAALDLAVSFEMVPSIVHMDDALQTASILRNWAGVLVVGPYDFNSDVRILSGAKALADAGVEIAFAGDGRVDSIRRTAHLAVRYGLDAAAARRGLSVNAARVCGAAGQVGVLAVGARADFVVLSRDPLRLDARVLGVWVGGSLVNEGEADHQTGMRWADEEHVPGKQD